MREQKSKRNRRDSRYLTANSIDKVFSVSIGLIFAEQLQKKGK